MATSTYMCIVLVGGPWVQNEHSHTKQMEQVYKQFCTAQQADIRPFCFMYRNCPRTAKASTAMSVGPIWLFILLSNLLTRHPFRIVWSDNRNCAADFYIIIAVLLSSSMTTNICLLRICWKHIYDLDRNNRCCQLLPLSMSVGIITKLIRPSHPFAPVLEKPSHSNVQFHLLTTNSILCQKHLKKF